MKLLNAIKKRLQSKSIAMCQACRNHVSYEVTKWRKAVAVVDTPRVINEGSENTF